MTKKSIISQVQREELQFCITVLESGAREGKILCEQGNFKPFRNLTVTFFFFFFLFTLLFPSSTITLSILSKWLTLGALNSTCIITVMFLMFLAHLFSGFPVPSLFQEQQLLESFQRPACFILLFLHSTTSNFTCTSLFSLAVQHLKYHAAWVLQKPRPQHANSQRALYTAHFFTAELRGIPRDEWEKCQPNPPLITLLILHLTNLSCIVWEDTCCLWKQNPLSSYNLGSRKHE